MCKSSLPFAASSEQDLKFRISGESRPDKGKNALTRVAEGSHRREARKKKRVSCGVFLRLNKTGFMFSSALVRGSLPTTTQHSTPKRSFKPGAVAKPSASNQGANTAPKKSPIPSYIYSAPLYIYRVALLLLKDCTRQGRRRPTPRFCAASAGGVTTAGTRVSAAAKIRPTTRTRQRYIAS
jgi:hypothetical protein